MKMNNSCTTRRISSIAIEYNGNDKGFAKMVYSQNLLGTTHEQIFQEMKMVANRNENVHKWALTGYVSVPHFANISEDKLTEITLQALRKMGMTNRNQAILDSHNSTKNFHIHFIVNRIQTNGKCSIKSAKCGDRFGKELRANLREHGIKTDVEFGIEKKAEMLQNLKNCLKSSNNFEQLVFQMNSLGFRVTLSQNEKIGISGMRIVRHDDINNQTERIYLPGFTLSQITNKLKIAEMKEIFNVKLFISKNLGVESLTDLKKRAESENLQIKVKYSTSMGKLQIEKLWIKPMSNDKSGFFCDKKMGFELSEIDPGLSKKFIENMNLEISTNQYENTKEQSVISTLEELVKDFIKPNYVSADDSLLKKKRKSIYDDESRHFRR